MLGVLRDKMLGDLTGSGSDRQRMMFGVLSEAGRTLVAYHHLRYDDSQNANNNDNNDDWL